MIPTNFEAIFSISRFFLMASKMAIFTGFGPRRAAGLAERSFFIFDNLVIFRSSARWLSAGWIINFRPRYIASFQFDGYIESLVVLNHRVQK